MCLSGISRLVLNAQSLSAPRTCNVSLPSATDKSTKAILPRSVHPDHNLKKESGPPPALEACLKTNLTLQLDLDDLEWFLAGIFRQVSEGIHVLHRASLCLDVLTLSIRVGEVGVRVRQKHSNRFRMAVHHRFLTRLVLDPNYSNSIIFELDRVMLGINFHGVIRDRLGYSCSCHCSCHRSLLSIQWDAKQSSMRSKESTPLHLSGIQRVEVHGIARTMASARRFAMSLGNETSVAGLSDT